MRFCLPVLIVPVSVYVPELLWVRLKVLRVDYVSIVHVLIVPDNSLYDALVTREVREARVHTHARPTEEE